MNQILSTELNTKKSGASIKTVQIVFAVCIILFGICVASGSTYAIYQSKFANRGQEPIINRETENEGQDVDEPEVVADEKLIEIDLAVLDIGEEDKIQATIKGKNEISFITYNLDNGEDIREDINSLSGVVDIEIPEGEHKLTVIAVDVEQNTETVIQEVKGKKGVKKPQLTVTHDGENFIVKTSDEGGLDRVEFELNGKGFLVRLNDVKEKEFSYPLEGKEGGDILKVTVYNSEGRSSTFNALCKAKVTQ